MFFRILGRYFRILGRYFRSCAFSKAPSKSVWCQMVLAASQCLTNANVEGSKTSSRMAKPVLRTSACALLKSTLGMKIGPSAASGGTNTVGGERWREEGGGVTKWVTPSCCDDSSHHHPAYRPNPSYTSRNLGVFSLSSGPPTSMVDRWTLFPVDSHLKKMAERTHREDHCS